MKIFELFEEREKGHSLKEIDPSSSFVIIYRALIASNGKLFNKMDYVTLSRKFAVEHAEHTAAIEGEPAHVIKKVVKSSDVYEAYNPGEYFYDGPVVEGKVFYVAKPE